MDSTVIHVGNNSNKHNDNDVVLQADPFPLPIKTAVSLQSCHEEGRSSSSSNNNEESIVVMLHRLLHDVVLPPDPFLPIKQGSSKTRNHHPLLRANGPR
jgi:hypothetical protein